MLVTINTDASFHQQFKIGAYAFWILCNTGKIMHSGELKTVVHNSTEAETMCIANALAALYKSSFEGVTKIIINTDCATFNGFIRNANRKRNEVAIKLEQIKSKLVERYNLKSGWLEVRHVKAHVGTDEKRKWVNDWCDKQAKKWLQGMVNKKRH